MRERHMTGLRRHARILASVCVISAAAAQPTGNAPIEFRLIESAGPVKIGGPFALCRSHTFQLVNLGPSIELKSTVTIERQVSGRWRDEEIKNFFLVETCPSRRDWPSPNPRCVSLAAGAVLQPAPWRGYSCDLQCPTSCDKNVVSPPGTYRFVVESCDGQRQIVSPPFQFAGVLIYGFEGKNLFPYVTADDCGR